MSHALLRLCLTPPSLLSSLWVVGLQEARIKTHCDVAAPSDRSTSSKEANCFVPLGLDTCGGERPLCSSLLYLSLALEDKVSGRPAGVDLLKS
jgi:hypothetical protein